MPSAGSEAHGISWPGRSRADHGHACGVAIRDSRPEKVMSREFNSPIVSTLHAEGRHIEAEWERLTINNSRSLATGSGLAAHRLAFFLGAVAVWQAVQDAGDDESVVDDLQTELEAFLVDMAKQGHITLSERPVGQSLQ
jgi:hypothetical protein